MQYHFEQHEFHISCQDGINSSQAYPREVGYEVILLCTVKGGSQRGGLNRRPLCDNGSGTSAILLTALLRPPWCWPSDKNERHYYPEIGLPHDGFLRS
ncbi:hypothetical protein PVK06_012092 [Gossypium arboreum]|uniref:Uncharacterized protein n=1 Tax=Gossypium arboreum TaxID=29729 RepID=A0ABR0QAS6_GOSAR|nr:hypothetical protein PVK06_012092 [Gossypium arboreum]